MVPNVKFISEEFVADASLFDFTAHDLLRARIEEVYNSFIGRRILRAKHDFLIRMEHAILEFVRANPCNYDRDYYCFHSKYSKRKRKKIGVGEFATPYKIHYISFGSYPPRMVGSGTLMFDVYGMYLSAIKSKDKRKAIAVKFKKR